MRRRPRLLAIVHHDERDLGQAKEVLERLNVAYDVCCPMTGDTLPCVGDHERGIIFGGIYSVLDDHLREMRVELEWIERALASKTPLVGICLGAQLIARALGASIMRAPKAACEVGFVRIEPTTAGETLFPPNKRVFYQWHEDGFDVPPEAKLLASGDRFPNHAFSYQDVSYGLQFHPEASPGQVRDWMTSSAHFLDRPGADTPAQQFADFERYGPVQEVWLDHFLTNWTTDTFSNQKSGRLAS